MNCLLPWRIAAWSAGIIPLGWIILRTTQGQLGANPVEFLEHYFGDWALRLLLVTLAMTPIRDLSGMSEAIRVRRVLGLWAYAFLCLHLLVYLFFDLEFSAAKLGLDLIKRPYITAGFSAWLILLPLAITSTNSWQRRLKRHWKSLHRLIYPAAILGAVHYLWLVKADTRTPLVYLSILGLLLAYRLPWKKWRTNPRPPGPASS